MQIKLHIETDQEVLKDVMVENNENDFYKEIGSVLPDLKTDLPQTLYVTSDLGSAEFYLGKRGTYTENGIDYPSMYVKEKKQFHSRINSCCLSRCLSYLHPSRI